MAAARKYRVKIKGRRGEQSYEIEDTTHHDAQAAEVAVKALRTYIDHGHGRYPYGGGELTVKVEELDDAR